MVTERDRIWNATVRVATEPTSDINPDTVLAELDDSVDRQTVEKTLTSMWELGVLRCADGGGRKEGTYRANPNIFDQSI